MSASGVLGVAALGLFPLGGVLAAAPPPPPLLLDDARYKMKVYLDSFLDGDNLTKDDGITHVNYAVMFAYPDYPLIKEFMTNNIDLLYLIDFPTSRPVEFTRYEESVPIIVACINKTGITGTKLKWKGELEVRRITRLHPLDSFRSLDRIGDSDERLGSTIIYSTTLILNYRRTAVFA